jgi:hypothetical protein
MSSKAITREGDKTTGHQDFPPRASRPAPSGASDNVLANNKGVNRVGDEWEHHPGKSPHVPGQYDKTADIPNASVFANNKAVARINDKVENDAIAGGSPNVFVGDNAEFASFAAPDVAFIVEQGDADGAADDPVTRSKVSSAVTNGVRSGVVSPSSPLLAPTQVGKVDSTPPPAYVNSTPVSGDFNNYNQDNIPYATLMLTEKTSLAEFTTKAALWGNQPSPPGPNARYSGGGDNKYIKAQYGLTVPQILNNLANLAKNVYEPIKARYPRVIVTNTFRQGPPGAGSNQAQHGLGMAMDLVFPGYTTAQYYDIAVWIRDNVPFDQLLQEKAGSKVWIHVSHYSGNGTQVPKQNKVANLIVSPYQFIPGLAPLA